MANPTYRQTSWRIRDDANGETSTTWLVAENTNYTTAELDTVYRIRFVVWEDSNRNAVNKTFQIEFNYDNEGWTNVNASSNKVRSAASQLVDGNDTTEHSMTAPAGGDPYFTGNAGQDDNDGLTGNIAAYNKNDYIHTEHSFTFHSASGAVAGKTCLFRINTATHTMTWASPVNASLSIVAGGVSQTASPARIIPRGAQAQWSSELARSASPSRVVLRGAQAQWKNTKIQAASAARVIMRGAQAQSKIVFKQSASAARVVLRSAQAFSTQKLSRAASAARVILRSAQAQSTGFLEQSASAARLILRTGIGSGVAEAPPIVQAASAARLILRGAQASSTGELSQAASPSRLVLRAAHVGIATPVRFRMDEGAGITITSDYQGIVGTRTGTAKWVDGKWGATPGTYGKAIHVSVASDGHYEIGLDPKIQPTIAITVTCWIQPQAVSGTIASVVGIRYDGGQHTYGIYHPGTGTALAAQIKTTGGIANTGNSNALDVGKWYLVALRWESGSNGNIRILNEDGTLFDNVNGASPSGELDYTGSDDLFIGKSPLVNNLVNDYIDDVRIYHHRLTDDDLYNLVPKMASPARIILRSAQASSKIGVFQSASPARLVLRSAQASSTGRLSQSASPARLVLRGEQASSTGTLSRDASAARIILRGGLGTGVQAGAPISQSASPARLVLRGAQASSTGTLSQAASPARLILRGVGASSSSALSRAASPARLVLRSVQAISTSELTQSASPARLILRTVQGSSKSTGQQGASPARLILRGAQASFTGIKSQAASPARVVLRVGTGTGIIDGAPQVRAASPARIVLRSAQATSASSLSQAASPARLILRGAQGSGRNVFAQAASPARVVLRTQTGSSHIRIGANPARIVLRTAQASWVLDLTFSAKPARIVLRTVTASTTGRTVQSAKPARIILRTVQAGSIVGELSHVIYYALDRAGNYFLATAPPRIHKAVAKVKQWIVK